MTRHSILVKGRIVKKMAYRKTVATEARKDARRKTILDAATRLFGATGYHSTTVPMIVEASDSSVGSFYAHFRNKEDVFAAVLEALGQKVTEVMDQARASQPDRAAGDSLRRGVAFSLSGRQPGGCAHPHRRVLRLEPPPGADAPRHTEAVRRKGVPDAGVGSSRIFRFCAIDRRPLPGGRRLRVSLQLAGRKPQRPPASRGSCTRRGRLQLPGHTMLR